MNTDTLNALVTGAIWRAEQMEALGIHPTAQVWAEVSSIEEHLAKSIAVTDAEGRIARRGAVRAALKAGDYTRANDLVDGYAAETGAPQALKTALWKMLDEDAQAIANQFQYAARHHDVREAQEFARHIRKAGAFGLAA